MTIVTRKFIFVDSEVEKTKFGRSGWRLADMPTFDPCHTNHVVCHDTFEHQPDDLPDIEHEMMAFGAIYFIRVHGDWPLFREVWRGAHGIMYSDIRLFLGDHKGWVISDCDGEICSELEFDYSEQIRQVKEQYADPFYDEKDDVNLQRILAGLERGFKWISKGYHRAQKRWAGHTSAQVCKLFEDTTEKVKKFSREDGKRLKHGDSLTIKFNTKRMESTVKFARRYTKRKNIEKIAA